MPPWVFRGLAPPGLLMLLASQSPPSPLAQEAEIFNLNQQGRGEAVVKLQKADIVRAESCLGVSALA